MKALESFKCFNSVLSRFLIKNLYLALYEPLVCKQILLISGC